MTGNELLDMGLAGAVLALVFRSALGLEVKPYLAVCIGALGQAALSRFSFDAIGPLGTPEQAQFVVGSLFVLLMLSIVHLVHER